MADFIHTGRLEAFNIAFAYGVTTDLVNDIVKRHDCDPVGAHLLGRALCAGVLSAGTLNPGERINIRWNYTGLPKTILVDAGRDGTTRGLISHPQLGKTDDVEASLFGEEATLQVVRTVKGAIRNSGTVSSVLQDVVNDLSYYYSISEQIETEMTIMIGFDADPNHPVQVCRGLLLQALPGCDLEVFQSFRENLHLQEARNLLAHDQVEADSHLENLLTQIAGGQKLGLQLQERPQPYFECTCNREKIEAVALTLPESERADIRAQQEGMVLHCQFCRNRYQLSPAECETIWANPSGEPGPT